MYIKINGIKIDKYNEVKVSSHYNSIASTFTFKVYFDPNNAQHRAAFRPDRYQPCEVWHENILIITGRCICSSFKDSAVQQLVSISGYSKTGVLEDCPCVYMPLQSDGLSLKSIAEQACRHYGINVIVDKEVADICNQPIATTTPEIDETVKYYLDVLCSQRNVILSHTNKGDLLLTKSKAGLLLTNTTTLVKPLITTIDTELDGLDTTANGNTINKTERAVLFNFSNGNKNTHWTDMELVFNGQKMHSDIVVMGQAADGSNATENEPVVNPYVPIDDFARRTTKYNRNNAAGIPYRGLRPLNKKQSSGDTNTTEIAARNVLSDELKSCTLSISVKGWTLGGNLITPNQMVTVVNPNCYLYNKTKFFIQDVDFEGDEKKDTAHITCVIPEAYNNDPVKNIFGDNIINQTK